MGHHSKSHHPQPPQPRPVPPNVNEKLPYIKIWTCTDGKLAVDANGNPHILYRMLLKAGHSLCQSEDRQLQRQMDQQKGRIVHPISDAESKAILKELRKGKDNGK